MPDYQKIYATQADEYDRLVAYEDYQSNLPAALFEVRSFPGAKVVELGAGTGRVTRLLAPVAQTIWAFDISRHMLDNAWARLGKSGLTNWRLAVADNRRLPVGDRVADVAIAGWSLGYFNARRYPRTWRAEIERTLAEMRRVLWPGGTVVLIETLGTGQQTPRPPTDELAAYYELLEKEHGFSTMAIRTDYLFPSLPEATALIRFFFGDELAGRVNREALLLLPECTGIWWLNV